MDEACRLRVSSREGLSGGASRLLSHSHLNGTLTLPAYSRFRLFSRGSSWRSWRLGGSISFEDDDEPSHLRPFGFGLRSYSWALPVTLVTVTWIMCFEWRQHACQSWRLCGRRNGGFLFGRAPTHKLGKHRKIKAANRSIWYFMMYCNWNAKKGN